jgi:hypothetical protein
MGHRVHTTGGLITCQVKLQRVLPLLFAPVEGNQHRSGPCAPALRRGFLAQ